MAHREIIESDMFRASKKALELSSKRLDEILEGSVVTLAERPTYFPQVPGTSLRRIHTEEFPPDIPSYRIWFTFNSQKVVLQFIELMPPEEL